MGTKTASPAETLHFYINTAPGGIIDSAFQLTDVVKSSGATIIGHLFGIAASAGTIIALACDQLKVADHAPCKELINANT